VHTVIVDKDHQGCEVRLTWSPHGGWGCEWVHKSSGVMKSLPNFAAADDPGKTGTAFVNACAYAKSWVSSEMHKRPHLAKFNLRRASC
jgi:hypothetical protein